MIDLITEVALGIRQIVSIPRFAAVQLAALGHSRILVFVDADFTTASVAVKLGSYSSVTAPAQDKPAANTSTLQTITIGPISLGDAAQVYALCNQLGLTAAGLYKSKWED